MSADLSLVLLDAGAPGRMIWARRDGRRVIWKPIEPGATAPLGARAALVVAPGEAVTARRLTLPKGSDRQARAAAPFALEDDIAVDVEDVHVALGPRAEDGGRLAYVVSRARMAAWARALDAAKITPSGLVPDHALIAAASAGGAGLSVLDLGERVLVTGPDGGFALETEIARHVLGGHVKAVPGPLTVRAADPGALEPTGGWPPQTALAPGLDEAGYLGLLLDGAASGITLDLRQGGFGGRELDLSGFAAWRRAGVLAAATGLVWAVSVGLQTRSLNREAANLRLEARSIYEALYPGQTAPRDVAAALRTAGGADNGLLENAALVFDAVSETSAVRLETISYDAERGGVAVTVTYGAYADLEALRIAVEQRGGTFEEGGSRRRGDRISGDLVVRAP